MSVVAKMHVTGIENKPAAEGEVHAILKMAPVYRTDEEKDASPEDISFTKATPYGTVELAITNPDALEQFQPGDKFMVHFEKVE